MTNVLWGDVAMFLLIWLFIYALALFLLSTISERRRARQVRKIRAKSTSTFFPSQLPQQMWGRRASPRREGNPTPVFLAEKDGPEWQTGACVVNRSEGGLRLTFSHPYDPGHKLRVLSKYAPNDVLFADVEVRNCREGSNGYELGCRFAYAHPLNVVLLFG
jgi:hypothetical protein